MALALDALLSLIPYLLLMVFVPTILEASKLPTTPDVVRHFRGTLAIYAGLLFLTWFSSSPQLTLLTSIYSLVILTRLAHEVLSEAPRQSNERRWLYLTAGWFIGLALLPLLTPPTMPLHVILYWAATVVGALVMAGAWLNTSLSPAGKGRLLAMAAHTVAMMIVIVSFVAWSHWSS